MSKNLQSVRQYAKEIAALRCGGKATEHSYRPALQNLIHAVIADSKAINESKQTGGNAPDFRVEWKSGALLGHIETKDIGENLDAVETSEQMRRYRNAFRNLLLTDYLEFRHYVNGDFCRAVRLADDIRDGKLCPPLAVKESAALAELLQEFADCGKSGEGESPAAEELAEVLARKTRLLKARTAAAMHDGNDDLESLYNAFREGLIKGLGRDKFADIFAQTAAYGLFAARLEAESRGQKSEFSRASAGEWLPQTTPFLRLFFNQFMRDDLDKKMADIADDIAHYLAAVNMENVLKSFRRNGASEEPFLHFYETFLKKYDPVERRLRGAYYTPDAAVDFIVRAADDCLRRCFELKGGLADDAKTGDGRHLVQILDPATGTGAFLVKILRLVKNKIDKRGGWVDYAVENLLPRLHGFEYMMSAYSVCHLKFALELGGETVEKLQAENARVKVFLTDTLDYAEHDYGKMGLGWLAGESRDADNVKTKTPMMVVTGNPPYSVSSQNRGARIAELLRDYKTGLNEKKLNLDDDYIKFIRNAEHLIAQNGRGIVAMIANNSFYDGVTHRRMREHLMQTFNRIYILNLHGNARIRERAPDGGADENVFDIMQGVGIFIFIKTDDDKKPAAVFYADCYGKRKTKYDFLLRETMESVKWQKLSPAQPYWFFAPKDFSLQKEYDEGIPVTDLFPVYNSGIQTKRDALTVCFSMDEIKNVKNDMATLDAESIRQKYNLPADGRDWTVEKAKADAQSGNAVFTPYLYRPFDIRHTLYTGKTKGVIAYPRDSVMRHFIGRENIALLTSRTIPANHDFDRAFLTNHIADIHSASDQTYFFPLYLHETMHGKTEKRATINPVAAAQIAKAANMQYAETGGDISPLDILDYVYACLHNPHYRNRYAEFLKINFPRIPKPKNKKHFCDTAKIGGQLRKLHLLQDETLDDGEIKYVGENNAVQKITAEPQTETTLRIKINADSYFANTPKTAWKFSIGGYLPAQKYLKDRKGKSLKSNDQQHYRRLITALAKTAEIVRGIGEI